LLPLEVEFYRSLNFLKSLQNNKSMQKVISFEQIFLNMEDKAEEETFVKKEIE